MGTCKVQTLRSKFNQYQIDSTCPLRQIDDEDITHMLLRCSALYLVRKEPFSTCILKEYIISRTSAVFWRSVFTNKDYVVKLIIDCGQLKELQSVKYLALLYVERLSRNACFILHTDRLKKLNKG